MASVLRPPPTDDSSAQPARPSARLALAILQLVLSSARLARLTAQLAPLSDEVLPRLPEDVSSVQLALRLAR